MEDPFKGVDRVEYRTYADPHQMATSYRSFTRDVKRLFNKRGGQYHTQTFKGNLYSTPALPGDGPKWFIVEFYPPPDSDIEVDGNPVELLFFFRSLYLLGFKVHEETKWQFFNDANKEGLTEEEVSVFIEELPFAGCYGSIGQNYLQLCIGYEGQLESYNVLSKFRERNGVQLKKALCRLVITICEAIRFIELMEFLITTFENGRLDKKLEMEAMPGEMYRTFSSHFTSWENYCKIIRGGEERFKELKPVGFLGLAALLSFVGVILPLSLPLDKLGIKVFFSQDWVPR